MKTYAKANTPIYPYICNTAQKFGQHGQNLKILKVPKSVHFIKTCITELACFTKKCAYISFFTVAAALDLFL